MLVVNHYLRAVVDHHASLRVHQQLTGVAVARLHGYALEIVLSGISAYAVHCRHPELSLLVVEQILHVIVRQSQRVLRAEILVIRMSVIAVQSSERRNP